MGERICFGCMGEIEAGKTCCVDVTDIKDKREAYAEAKRRADRAMTAWRAGRIPMADCNRAVDDLDQLTQELYSAGIKPW